jgi:hypothetical protein
VKKLTFYLLAFCLFGCGLQSEDFSYLEGFWEIQSVKINGQTNKSFKASINIDHYVFKDSMSGIFQKVIPQFDGQFKASENYSVFSVQKVNNRWWIYHTNIDQNYRLKVIDLSSDLLILRKDSSTTDYVYKRFEPLNLGDL